MLTFDRASWARAEPAARRVLAQGSVAAGVLARDLDRFSTCWLIDPIVARDAQSGPGDALVERAAQPDRDACLGSFVGMLPGVRTVLVEDTPAPRVDAPVGNFASIDDRAIRWADVSDGLLEASQLLRPSGDGVPLCGYLSSGSSRELGLSRECILSAPQVARLAASIVAVIVPVCDSDAQFALCLDLPSSALGACTNRLGWAPQGYRGKFDRP